MTTQTTTTPNTRKEFKAAAQTLAATFKGTSNEAEVNEIISATYEVASQEVKENPRYGIWAANWRDMVHKVKAL